MLQTESHTSREFAARATQRSKHGFEALSSQFAEFRLARAFFLRLLGRICGENAVVALDTHIINPYNVKKRNVFIPRPQTRVPQSHPSSLMIDRICAFGAAGLTVSRGVPMMGNELTRRSVRKEYLGLSFSISFKLSSYFWP